MADKVKKPGKGLACPHCGAVQKYSGGQNHKIPGAIFRDKLCKDCGATFETVEAVVRLKVVPGTTL